MGGLWDPRPQLVSPVYVFTCHWPEILLFLSCASCGVLWTSMGCGNRSCSHQREGYQSLSPSNVIRNTVLSESSCECVLSWYEGASSSARASHPGKCMADGGVFPSHTPMPRSQGQWCPLSAIFWTLQTSSQVHEETTSLCNELHPRGRCKWYFSSGLLAFFFFLSFFFLLFFLMVTCLFFFFF